MTTPEKNTQRKVLSKTFVQPIVKTDFRVQLQNFFKLLFSFVLVGGDLA